MLCGIGGLEFIGEGGKQPTIHPWPGAILTLKLYTNLRVVEANHLHGRERNNNGGELKDLENED